MSNETGTFEVVDRRNFDEAGESLLPEPIAPVPDPPITSKPLGGHVLLQRIERVQGTIVEADTAKEPSIECRVEAVADGIDSVQVGQMVMIRKFAGTEIKADLLHQSKGKEFTILRVEDILLIL